jgi:cytochrome c biogenesis protein CcdA
VFYAGLAGVLVPLGMGSSAASALVYGHQAALTTTAGVILIGFGVMQLAAGGFTIPGLTRLRARVRGQSVLSVLALGAVSGLAGFCAGPSWARCSPSPPPPASRRAARCCWPSTPPG